METVTLQTESYLFQNSDGQFRAIPFYELSIDEFVELLLDSFEVVVEGSDLLGAQLEACGLVPTAIQSLESHQYYWLVGF